MLKTIGTVLLLWLLCALSVLLRDESRSPEETLALAEKLFGL